MVNERNSIIEHLRIHGSPANLKVLTLRLPADLEQDIREVVEREEIKLAVVLRASVALGWKQIRDELEGV
jgi:hypothetical protein